MGSLLRQRRRWNGVGAREFSARSSGSQAETGGRAPDAIAAVVCRYICSGQLSIEP